jgi:iron complex outermembrane receptor protein
MRISNHKLTAFRGLFGSTALGSALCLASSAFAQQGAAPSVQTPSTPVEAPAAAPAPQEAAAGPAIQPGDIVVTAQRRSQLALRTPLSLTALDTTALEQKQVTSLTDLAFVAPGVRSGAQNGVNRVFIRGIGLTSFASGADSSVAFYVDGVYVGRPTAQLSAFYDISRIEVLRGPQGALYGRNATGGAINLITNGPSRELSGYVNATIGNYNLHQLEGAVSAPLTEGGDLRARIAFKTLDRSGYGYDFAAKHDVNDAKSQSLRATLQYNPDPSIDIRLIGGYTHERDDNNYTINYGAYPGYKLSGVVDFGGFAIQNSQDAATPIPSHSNRRTGYDATLNATFALTDELSLSSISGWRQFERFNNSSSDGTSYGLGISSYTERNNQESQEFVLNYDANPVVFTGGASYYHEHIFNNTLVPFIQLPGINYIQNGTLDIDALAAYLQATWSITEHLRVTGAGRYNTEKRSTQGSFTFGTVTPLDDHRRWSAFTPKFGLEYDVTTGTMVYASATKGFKSGTFTTGQVNPAVNPEKIWAYEAGVKSRFLDNKLDIAAAVFYYDYSDLQVNKILGLATLTTNAASARNKGIEISAHARPTTQFTLDASFSYTDATFKDFNSVNPLFPTQPAVDLQGKSLPGSPRYQATFGGAYWIMLPSDRKLTFAADASYQSRIYFSEFNDKVLSQKSFTKINTSAKLELTHNVSVTVWGKNITNKQTAGNKTLGIQLWGFPIYGSIDAPATYGGTLAVSF